MARNDERIVEESTGGVHRRLADALRDQILRHDSARGPFRLALSGGSSPLPLYDLLRSGYPEIPWQKTQVYFVDERCVPPAHPESNFGRVKGRLLDHLSPGPSKVLRMRGDLADADKAAREYASILRKELSSGRTGLDLVLLGMGPDGHTASLFPGSPAVQESTLWVLAVDGPEDAAVRRRITLTLPLLNRSAEVYFLITGQAKAHALERVLARGDDTLPATGVRPREGRITWFLDRHAASRLQE